MCREKAPLGSGELRLGKGKAKQEVTAQTARKRLGHIHDFIMARFCQIDVGREFLYLIEDKMKHQELPRLMSLAELVGDQVFLEAAKLLDRDTRALSLHTLTEGVYLDLIENKDARERLRSLVKEASVEGKPLVTFRNKWLAHQEKDRSVLLRHGNLFNQAATTVLRITDEILDILSESQGIMRPTVDEYLSARWYDRSDKPYDW